MRLGSAIFNVGMPAMFGNWAARRMGKEGSQPMGGKKSKTGADVRKKKPLPTKDAPFQIDPNDDGDFASPKRELTEDEIKEQEDRSS